MSSSPCSLSAAALGADPATAQWLRLFGHPVFTFIFVAGLTIWVQSSTASIGFATANLLVRVVVAAGLLFVSVLAGSLFGLLPGGPARELAMFHAGFNLLIGLLAIPLISPLTRVVSMMIVPREPNETGLPGVSIPLALESPSPWPMGLKVMLQSFWRGYASRDRLLIWLSSNRTTAWTPPTAASRTTSAASRAV